MKGFTTNNQLSEVKLTAWQKMAIEVAVERTPMEPRSKAELLRILGDAVEMTAALIDRR